MKKTIRVAYKDLWKNFDPKKTKLLQILSKDFDLISDDNDPDIVFCSLFGHEALQYDCPRLLYIGEAVSPDFRNYDYVIGFDYLEYPNRYLRIPLYLLHNPDTLYDTRKKHLRPDSFYEQKDSFCSFIFSNGKADSGRDAFFSAIERAKTCGFRRWAFKQYARWKKGGRQDEVSGIVSV